MQGISRAMDKGPDLQEFWACTMTVEGTDGRDHLCGHKAVAVYEGPLGRLPRCSRHERPVQAAGYTRS